ncbi:unnamed protein product [Hymenolepis diminuta]|uniref:Uncharacterized protein n=1 Tax=Hymenolepis diminuta TaxID=6216 RepID=A0A564XXX1_HYMDI|nr:unnamed protein product [Hymenolepis diminuta]
MERRTDFDMKATELAEVVDVVTDVGEEVGCEEVFEDGAVGEFVATVTFGAVLVAFVVEFASAPAAAWELLTTTETKSRIMSVRILFDADYVSEAQYAINGISLWLKIFYSQQKELEGEIRIKIPFEIIEK